jgi:hypothetical protein
MVSVGSSAVSSIGIALQGSSLSNSNSNDVMLDADGCSVTTAGSGDNVAVSSIGIALRGGSSGSNNNSVILLANGCNVNATGIGNNAAVSSIGIALMSVGSTIDSNVIFLVVSGCEVTATSWVSAISSIGIALVSGGAYASTSNCNNNNITLQVSSCDVTATGSAAVSSSGIALSSLGPSNSNSNNLTFLVTGCRVMTTANTNAAVSSTGIALYGRSSSCNSNNITLLAKSCSVVATVTGGNGAVSSTGVSLYSQGGSSSCNNNVMTLCVYGRSITASGLGGDSVVSTTGIALYSVLSSSSANSNNISLEVRWCTVMTTGSGNAVVTSTGIAMYGGGIYTSSSSNSNSITLKASKCNVTTMGSGGVASVSITGITLYSRGGSSFSANTVVASTVASAMLLHSSSNLSCGAALGLCVHPSPLPSSLTGNVLRIQSCNVSITATGEGPQSALGSIPLTSAALSLSNVSVTSAAPTSLVSCLSFVPINASVFDGLAATCRSVGWAPGLGFGLPINIFVQQTILNETVLTGQNFTQARTLLPGLLPSAFTWTNESFAAFSAVREACATELRRWQIPEGDTRTVSRSPTGFSSTFTSSMSSTSGVPSYLTIGPRSGSPNPVIIGSPSNSSSLTLSLSASLTQKRLRPSSDASSSPKKDDGCCLNSESRPQLAFTTSSLISVTMHLITHPAVISPPRNRRNSLNRILGEQATVGVTATSVTASVVCSGVLSSGAVTRVPIMRSLQASIRCAWVEKELDDRPSYLDLPLQFLSIGDHPKLRYFAGGVVLCGLFVLLWELMSLLCFKILQGGRVHRKVESMLGIGSLLWQGYLVPNVAQAAVIVCWHSGGLSALSASAMAFLAVVGYSVAKWLWLLLPSQFTAHFPTITVSRSNDGQTVKVDYSAGSAASESWLRFFGPMFEDTVDPGRMICRVVVMEEVAVGVVLSILAGIKPEDDESCRYTAASMLAVTVLHFLYLLVFRPYRTKLDAMFANINAFLMFCQGSFAVIITVEGLGEGPLLTSFGTLGLLQLLLPVLQLIVGGFYSQILKRRRRRLEPEYDSTESGGVPSIGIGEIEDRTDPNHLEAALLKAPQSAVESNPLANLQRTKPVRVFEVSKQVDPFHFVDAEGES